MSKKVLCIRSAVVISLIILGGFCINCYAEEPKEVSQEEKILAGVEEKKGFRPGPLMLMSERENVLINFMAYAKQTFEGGPLTEKESYLVALSAAVALKSPICIREHAKSAKKAGASSDEITQAILIAGVISNTSPLHIVYDSIEALNTNR